jgi:hypothetical protein
MKITMKLAVLALSAMLASVAAAGEGIVLEIDPQAVMEILPLAAEALAIQQRAMEREAKHAAELKKKGNGLYCEKCEKTTPRKLADDYGDVVF